MRYIGQRERRYAASPTTTAQPGHNRAVLSERTGASNMNGYKAFYRGKQIDVYAQTSMEAQTKAAAILKAKKRYDVTVVLCELGSKQVEHVPVD